MIWRMPVKEVEWYGEGDSEERYMKEKKSMREREKLIKSEHIRAAADEIISPLYKP